MRGALAQPSPAIVYTSERRVCFSIVFSLNPKKTLELLEEEEERSQRAVGSLLLQIQMFIRSAKHRYKVSWKGEGGRHVASQRGELMSCELHPEIRHPI